MATKNNMLKCKLDAELGTVLFWESTRVDGNLQTLEQAMQAEGRMSKFKAKKLPDAIQQECLVYGLRAYLADRTSQFRAAGIEAVLAEMQAVYDLFASGQLKAPTKRAGMDPALVQLIVNLKSISAVQAEAALKSLSTAQREAIEAKYAEDLTSIRNELALASDVDLGDLF